MATIQEIIEALDTYLEGVNGLGITFVRGYPDFRRPDISPPIGAIFYAGSREITTRRVGAALKSLAVTVAVYAGDESALFGYAGSLADLRKEKIILSAGSGSDQVWLEVDQDERQPPEPDDPKELRHMLTCEMILIYEEK
jgi:hypothetical protein